jgi:hypothetical protein
MEATGGREHHRVGMERLIVMWIDPLHLSAAEAEAWVCEETRRLLELNDVEALELARLAPASERHALPWNWLLDVRLASGSVCVDEPLFVEWLGDLRLLGMRPVVVRVGDTPALERES